MPTVSCEYTTYAPSLKITGASRLQLIKARRSNLVTNSILKQIRCFTFKRIRYTSNPHLSSGLTIDHA